MNCHFNVAMMDDFLNVITNVLINVSTVLKRIVELQLSFKSFFYLIFIK